MSSSQWGSKFDFKIKPPHSLMASNCRRNDGDNSHWELTRIGPFTTVGGYDWIQVGWDNVFGFEKHLASHPGRLFLLEQFMSPVFENSTMIQHPPIHIHHMHVGQTLLILND
jgi:hypothetical protein